MDDEELREIIKGSNIYDLMKIIQEEYSLDEIIGELPSDKILENISEEDRLESLNHSWTLEQHDEEIRNIQYREYIDEWIDEMRANEKDQMSQLQNCYSDNLHEFICNLIGVGYYDKEGLMKGLEKLKDKLNKNSYGIKYA